MDGDGNDDGGYAVPYMPERRAPEDTAEYMLFVLDDAQNGDGGGHVAATKPLVKLDQLRKAALKLSDELTTDYIWQRDAFNLEVVSRNGLLYLRGMTSYGDCVEDEWLIVYMLRELSRSFPGVWARIGDGDGEFLLAEAAKAVPKWLNPEMDANRVWIHDGRLLLIPAPPAGAGPQGRLSLKLAEAVHIIKTAPDTLLHIPALEEEAFHRLKKYPGHVAASIYHTRLVVPRTIAFILHDRPRAVAPAVEAFVQRDPLTTKRIYDAPDTALKFPPTDLVAVSVKFTKVLFAELRGQRFTPPKGWPGMFAACADAKLQPSADNGAKGTAKQDGGVDRGKIETMSELGMKLTCGFELMVASAETSNSRIVREVGIVLEDLAEDGDAGDAAALLPSDEQIRAWKDVDREDDDSWLDISFEDFERELDSGRQAQPGAPSARSEAKSQSGFGDAGVQTDLRRIVSQFQAFLNDNDAGMEGAEFDEMDEDDDEDEGEDDDESEEDDGVEFDEAEFSRLMREMMGLPPSEETATTGATDPKRATSSTRTTAREESTRDAGALASRNQDADDDNDDDEGILELAAQFAAELKEHGALRLDPPTKGKQRAGLSENKTIRAGGEPARSGTAGSTKHGDDGDNEDDEDDDDDDDDDDGDEGELNVDLNLVKNLLESIKGQEGMSGPAGNILSMLGMALPRDADNDEEVEEEEK